MPTLTIKNIPEDLYIRLKRYAEINRRSLNSEVILCIERAVYSYRIQPEEYLARARRLREKTLGHPIADDEFTEAKAAGRP
jgi:plasmid stability protein